MFKKKELRQQFKTDNLEKYFVYIKYFSVKKYTQFSYKEKGQKVMECLLN
jgi:hypothetical protein